jgi:hypothetical protein
MALLKFHSFQGISYKRGFKIDVHLACPGCFIRKHAAVHFKNGDSIGIKGKLLKLMIWEFKFVDWMIVIKRLKIKLRSIPELKA